MCIRDRCEDSIIWTIGRFQNLKKFQFLKAGGYVKKIVRKNYLERIIELNGTPEIKIITGIRRSGQSKMMQSYIAVSYTTLDVYKRQL